VKRWFVFGACLLVIAASSASAAADIVVKATAIDGRCDPFVDYNCVASKAAIAAAKAAAQRNGYCDPYLKYSCLNAYLGDNLVARFVRYYELEWGKAVIPNRAVALPPRGLGPRRLPCHYIRDLRTAKW
jgi:hypothetical protein